MTLAWDDLTPDEQREALRYTEARRVAAEERRAAAKAMEGKKLSAPRETFGNIPADPRQLIGKPFRIGLTRSYVIDDAVEFDGGCTLTLGKLVSDGETP